MIGVGIGDDTWDIEEVCDDHMVNNFTNYLNETILKDIN